MQRTPRITGRRLAGLETLTPRLLMAADISLSRGLLEIQGTDSTDIIEIEHSSLLTSRGTVLAIEATVMDKAGRVRVTNSFQASYVDRILVEGLGGSDTIRNLTNRPSELHGGAGVDREVFCACCGCSGCGGAP